MWFRFVVESWELRKLIGCVCAGLSLGSLILSLCAFFFFNLYSLLLKFVLLLCWSRKSIGWIIQLNSVVCPAIWLNVVKWNTFYCCELLTYDSIRWTVFFYLFCLNIFICSRWRIDECREDISSGDMSSDIDEVFNFRKSIKYMVIGHSFTPTYVRNGSCQQYGQWAGWPFRNCASFCKCVSVWECHSSPFRLCRQDAWA